MNDLETQSGQQVAAAERGPETVLPGPRSLSVLDAVREMIKKPFTEASENRDRAGVNHWESSRVYWAGYANALADLKGALDRAEIEASKENDMDEGLRSSASDNTTNDL